MKARDLMTGTLITCSPDASVAQAAKIMRDHNTGDVLVTENGKLVGILTDRDIAVRVAAKESDPKQVPVSKYMSRHMVTGQPTWDVDKVTKTMGNHQVRRLPITDKGMLVGIVSLGDIALRTARNGHLTKSLMQISEPRALHTIKQGRSRLLWTLGLGLVAGGVIALTMSPKSFASMVERVQDNGLDDRISDVKDRLSDVVEQIQDSKIRERALDAIDKIQDSKIRDRVLDAIDTIQDSKVADAVLKAVEEGRDRFAKLAA